MTVLLPETRKPEKRGRITQSCPSIWLWPRTFGLSREIRQAYNQYKHSNSKSELLMRCWSGIISMGLKMKRVSSSARNLLKGSYTGWKRRARILDRRRKVILCSWKSISQGLAIGNGSPWLHACGNGSASLLLGQGDYRWSDHFLHLPQFPSVSKEHWTSLPDSSLHPSTPSLIKERIRERSRPP